MNIDVISCISDLKKIEEEWKTLELQDKESTFFQPFNYNYFWWETVKDNKKYKLSILIGQEENRKLLAIEPFYIEFLKKLQILKNILSEVIKLFKLKMGNKK